MLCIVDPSIRLTRAWKSIEAGDSCTLREPIRRLVTTTRQLVQIKRVYGDHSFYCFPLVKELLNLNVEFVMRAPKMQRV